jgi:hypothetical protein
MHDGEVDITDVIGGLVVLDEAAGPIIGLDDEVIARLDPRHDRDIRMPAIVDHVVLVGRFRQIDLDQGLGLRTPAFFQGLVHRLLLR